MTARSTNSFASSAHGDRQLALQVAHSTEVTSFGSFTKAVSLTVTPTVLIVNDRRQVSTVTGLTDSFSLRQAIGDASHGAGRVLAPRFSSWTPTSSRARFIAQANRMCKRASGPSRKELASLGSVKAILAAIVNSVATVYRKVEGLRIPSQDRAFVHRQFGLVLATLQRQGGPLDAANALHWRQVFLESEASADEAFNGLQAYGLTNCI